MVVDICKVIVDYISDFKIEVEMKNQYFQKNSEDSVLEFMNKFDNLMMVYLIAGEVFTVQRDLYNDFMNVCPEYQGYNQSFIVTLP